MTIPTATARRTLKIWCVLEFNSQERYSPAQTNRRIQATLRTRPIPQYESNVLVGSYLSAIQPLWNCTQKAKAKQIVKATKSDRTSRMRSSVLARNILLNYKNCEG